ncbi:sensor histidine kinase [Parabacteroides sp.]
MTKSFYIILTAVAVFIVLFLMGQWIGRSYSLTKDLLARQVYEAFCHATERYDADQTNVFPALFREELNKKDLNKLMFRIDTVSLSDPKTVLRKDIRYFSDYEQLLNERHTFAYPIDDTQGIRAHIINPRAGSIGRLLYYFFGTAIALVILLIGIQKQTDIIKRQDEIARMREDFSYAMIHDMKNPLSTILTGTRILRSGKLDKMPDKKDKFFDILEEEAEHLMALANKVLTISKLEHGQLLLEKDWIPIRPMIEELTRMFSAKTNKPVTFKLNLEKEEIFADEEYLKEAVSNLIDNAIKYSKETVEIQIASCTYNKFIQIKVRDNGIGISLSEQNHIFDKFERASASRRSAANGVTGFGLGLNYVMNAARSHGGYVSVESKEGKYSEFTISLPLPTENEITV